MRSLVNDCTSSTARVCDIGSWSSRPRVALRNLFAALAAVVLVATSVQQGVAASSTVPTSTARATTATCTSSVGPGIPPPASVPSGIPGFHAAWYGQSGYMTLCPGETSTATVAMYNSGSAGWVRGVLGQVAYLGTWNPTPGQDQPSAFGGDGQLGSPSTGWPRYNRVAVQPAEYVGPNQIAWFQFSVKAPQAPGSYGFYIRPLIEGAQWMEDFGIFWQITVPGEETTGWSRGIYLQAQDPATGFTASNTKLVSVTNALQRTDLHPGIAWLYTGPWSPEGNGVVAGDRSGNSYVIWPDGLVGLPTQTSWTWTDPITVSGIAPGAGGGVDLLRANARTGQLVQRRALANVETQSGAIASPRGDWVSFSTSVPDFLGEAVTVSVSGSRVGSGPQTHPVGWLPDGRFAFIRLASGVWTVEVRDPARADATVVGRFTDITDALAQSSANVIVARDVRANRLWAIRGTTVTPVPLPTPFTEQVTLESLSRDGRTLSFSVGSFATARTGVIDLQTGAVTFMCTAGCWRLVIS
jgi:hypothetical protein